MALYFVTISGVHLKNRFTVHLFSNHPLPFLLQGKLSKAETVEKNTLPTKEVIEAEKKA